MWQRGLPQVIAWRTLIEVSGADNGRRGTPCAAPREQRNRATRAQQVLCEALRLLSAREELFASHRDELRAQIAAGVAAEKRGELRDGEQAIREVRRRIDERLRRGE